MGGGAFELGGQGEGEEQDECDWERAHEAARSGRCVRRVMYLRMESPAGGRYDARRLAMATVLSAYRETLSITLVAHLSLRSCKSDSAFGGHRGRRQVG